MVLDDDGIKCQCVVTDEDGGILEIKNIATEPDCQGKGYGRTMIEYVAAKYKGTYSVLQVGTGDSPATLPFYEKCGFCRSHVVRNFFTENYDHPIYECGKTACGYGVSEKWNWGRGRDEERKHRGR